MARRFGCFALLLAVIAASLGVLIVWLVSTLLGFAGPEHPLAGMARVAGIVALAVGAATVVIGIRLARGIGPRLGDLIEAAGRVEAGDYAARVPEVRQGPAELRQLASAFNAMTARLGSDDERRRRLLADVGHELRTPLAVIQGNLEALIDGVYPADETHLAPVLEETRVMARLIEDLRTLSLAEAGALPLHREPTDVVILATEVASSFRAQAQSAGAEVRVDAEPGLPLVELDPIRLREVLVNLVDNALRYSPSGGVVQISIRTAGKRLEITVDDDGPGIRPDLLPAVFDRFARSAESRGSGLGLAIAKGIVVAHGGDISAASRPTGGASIRLGLPVP